MPSACIPVGVLAGGRSLSLDADASFRIWSAMSSSDSSEICEPAGPDASASSEGEILDARARRCRRRAELTARGPRVVVAVVADLEISSLPPIAALADERLPGLPVLESPPRYHLVGLVATCWALRHVSEAASADSLVLRQCVHRKRRQAAPRGWLEYDLEHAVTGVQPHALAAEPSRRSLHQLQRVVNADPHLRGFLRGAANSRVRRVRGGHRCGLPHGE